jgi:FixJ family two-component response regulator
LSSPTSAERQPLQPGDTVYVVDDDASTREALGSLVRSVGLHAATFASAQAFLEGERVDAPGCLILDVRLPGLSGLDLQRRLVDAGNAIPIVFITGHGDIPMSVQAIKAGAVEFLPKPFRDQDLLDAIRLALDLDRTRRAAEQLVASLRTRFQSLTPREREVMAWVISGWLNKQIAAEIGTSEMTVKVHRGRVMHKMGAGSVAELVTMAVRIGVPARTSSAEPDQANPSKPT